MKKTRFHLRSEVRRLLSDIRSFLHQRVELAYVTGGFVRDAISGVPPWDVDLSIEGDPISLGPKLADDLGGTFFILDEERCHVRILVPDHDLHVDLLPLRGTIENDLRLRDYTVDAMAVALEEVSGGEVSVIDPLGGLADLSRGIVRCVSERALKDDPLRTLRGARIATERGFTVEPETEAIIRRNAGSLAAVAAERQREELVRILKTDDAGGGFRLLDSLRILPALFPEAEVMRGVQQPKEHHWDVLGHAFVCVEMLDSLLAASEPAAPDGKKLWATLRSELAWWDGRSSYLSEEIVRGAPRSAIVKLCGFLHDIGKPETKSIDENGRMRFFGHSDAGAALAAAALRRLRFSAGEIDFVRKMIEAHLRPVQMAQQGPPTDRAVFRYFRATGDAGIATLFLSLADHLATVGPRRSWEGWRQHVALVGYILRKRVLDESVVSPPKLVRGTDLIDALGIEPGPVVGGLLAKIEEAQAAGDVTTRKQAIALAREELQRERA
ncbi:MAG: HD domain-containing protein [Dehalococcoidia bacterium]